MEHISHFRCELSPSTGPAAAMIMECSAHANSLLLALGCQGVGKLCAAYSPSCGHQSALLDLRFVSRNIHGGSVQSEYHFAQQAVQPRHAAAGDHLHGPVSINLDLTSAFDYRCGHCIDSELLNGGRHLPPETLFGTLDVMARRGLRSVILIGGGEPIRPRQAADLFL